MRLFYVLLVGGSLATHPLQAQGIFKKLKQKAEQVTTDGLGKKMETTADKTVNGEKVSDKSSATSGTSGAAASTSGGEKTGSAVQSFSKFDFIPGNKVLFEENFGKDRVGEFALKWFTKSSGEVVTISGQQGQWLRIFPDGIYMAPPVQLKDDYTVEFDVILDWPNGGENLTGFLSSLVVSLHDGGNAKAMVRYDYQPKEVATLSIMPKSGKTDVRFSVFDINDKQGFKTPTLTNKSLVGKSGRVVHMAICVQKQRFRAWIDQEKIFDLPNALPENSVFNTLQFSMGSTGYSPEQIGYYLTNIKMAAGVPDTREKILATGKYVTTGISFDVNSDRIKPVSYPVIKQIAVVLQEEPGLQVHIVGHTDSDGSEKDNLDLSKRRAEAVKQYLVREFSIEEKRMTTTGKGESEPLKKELSAEDKANNRRVEFIRI